MCLLLKQHLRFGLALTIAYFRIACMHTCTQSHARAREAHTIIIVVININKTTILGVRSVSATLVPKVI